MATPLEDRQARAQALDPTRSCIVQAPAGSGKTELLIQRFLVLLAQVDAPEEIVAITFTRKAAGEMRGRILAALTAAAGDAPAEPHRKHTWDLARTALARDQAQGWALTEHPARLRVVTIDAFNLSLVRRLPWLSRLGGAPATVDDAGPFFRRAARETLAQVEGDEPAAQHTARLLQHLDNQVERTEGLLGALLSKRDQWLRHLGAPGSVPVRAELEAAWGRVLAEMLATIAQALRPHATEIVAAAAHATSVLKSTQPDSEVLACSGMKALPAPTPEHADAWRGLAALLLTGAGEWRSPKGLNKNNGFPVDTAPQKAAKTRAQGLFDNLRDDNAAARVPELLSALPNARFTDAEWEVIAALLGLLPEATQALREAFRRGGVADFIEIALAAQGALQAADSTDGLRHLLLDEFQDTSTSQFRLVEQLVAGWKPDDGRTLFLVGDPMQSIYRFREAEVGLFLRAWQQGIGSTPLAPLVLRSNFRSEASIVSWVNRTFAEVFPTQPDVATGAVPYSEAVAARPAADAPAVQVHPIVVPAGEREWGVQLEAARVADLAYAARAQSPGGSVAILVRARTHLAEVLPALRAVEVPYRAVEIDALAEQPVVVDLMALTRALLFPADRVAWLAILRAPSCGLTLADLLVLAGEAPGMALWMRIADDAVLERLSTDGRARLSRVRDVLAIALGARARQSLRAWVEGTWLALGGPVGLRELELSHARSFLVALEALEQGGIEPTPEELSRCLEGLYADPDPDPTAVQVMTIHKAKGLEFDTVILPGLARRSRPDSPPLLRWHELPGGAAGSLLLTPIGETGLEQNPNFQYLARVERAKADQELRRVIYVAATRAKDHLHLLGVATADDQGLRAPDARSLLGMLWSAVEHDFHAAKVEAQGALPAWEDVTDATSLRRLPSEWAAPALPPDVRPAMGTEPEEPKEAIEYSWVGFTARRVGVAVHRLLLRMARDGADVWSSARVDGQAPALRTLLAQEGVADAELDGATLRALDALRATLADAKGCWILQRHEQDRSEYAVSALLDGEVRRLRVDRTFVDAEGRRWIIDYKTSTHEGGDVQGFLDHEVDRYREAMERYARVLTAMDPGRPVHLALYFPLVAGGWREWAFTG